MSFQKVQEKFHNTWKIGLWTRLTLSLPCFGAAFCMLMIIVESLNYQTWVGLIFTIGADIAMFGAMMICVCLGCMLIIWDD